MMREMTNLKYLTNQMLDAYKTSILEQYPNLNPDYIPNLIFLVIGEEIHMGFYAGLQFPLKDDRHLPELKDLSNGYLEYFNGNVKMGVTKLENLEKILRAPYIEPRTINILER